MPNVKMPDGVVVAFPDDMPADKIKALILTKFPDVGLSEQPPAGAAPGSREYADWAAKRARAGKSLPQVSKTTPTQTLADQIMAGYTSAVDAVPIAGPMLKSGVQGLKAGMYGVPQHQVAAEDTARQDANPVASTVGSVAGTVVPFMAAGAIPGVGKLLGMAGNLPTRAVMGGFSGAGITALDSKARGKTDDEAKTDAMIGGGIGAALPLAGAVAKRVISPALSSSAQRAAVKTMEKEGVTLTAGQKTGSKKLKYLESELGGGTADALVEKQGRQFTAAVLKRAGVVADSAEPQVIDQAFTQIGQQFDGLAARNMIQADKKLMTDLDAVWKDYASTVNPSARAPVVANTIQEVAQAIQQSGGALRGDVYQATRSRLDRLARSTSDPELMSALRGARSALDDAMERTIAKYNPSDLDAWRKVRRQYANMLVIEKAATGAGEQAASGIITPARLRAAAIQQNRRAFARGRNEFTDLANAGVQTMTPMPQSGTAPRLAARAVASLPAALGAVIGSPGGFIGAGVGAAAGAALPWAAGRAALSGPGRAYLSNQLLSGLPQQALLAPATGGLLSN